MIRPGSRLLVAALVSLSPCVAWALPTREAVDAEAIRQLHERSPSAESCYVAAVAAEERGERELATRLYHRVGLLVPGHVHALRREGIGLVAQGRRVEGLALVQAAAARIRSPLNLSALAHALMWHPNGESPSPDVVALAAGHARAALEMDVTDPELAFLLCRIALARNDLVDFRYAVTALEQSAPDSLQTQIFSSMAHNAVGDRTLAIRALDRARALGLPDSVYRQIRGEIRGERRHVLVAASAWGAGVWLALLALLMVAGLALSAATLQRARRVPNTQDGEVRGGDALVRRLYVAVLWISCAYYYVSLPIVILLVLALAGGLVYGAFAVGHVPIKLVLLVVILALVTVWVTVRSAFVRGRDTDPGERLDLDQHPRLREELDRVAERIDTRAVQSVFLTPGAEVAVYERGGMLRQLRGDAERCMILGAAAIEGMTMGPFRAVLAHEYGHFSNRDTAGGGFALAVRRSLMTMVMGLAAGGAAAWYNPAWLFANGFHRVFTRISQGASRLQEVLADRWAALAYGAAAFETGLRQVIAAEVRFQAHLDATLHQVIEKQQPLSNLYRFRPLLPVPESDVASAIERALEAEPSAYDSHPAPRDRFAWVHRLTTPDARTSADDGDPVWSLFQDRDALERRMTDHIRGWVEAQGASIPGEDRHPADRPPVDSR